MAKRSKGGRSADKAGYQPTAAKAQQLKRAVENFNKRINRRLAKVPEDQRQFYPTPLKYSEIKSRLTSTRELNKVIQTLDLYRDTGLQLTEYKGIITTKADVTRAQRMARAENARRRQIARAAKQLQKQQGRFPTQTTVDLEPVSPEKMLKSRRNIYEEAMEGRNIDDRATALQQRYLFHLEQARAQGILAGVMTPELDADITRIREIIMSLTPIQMVAAQVAVPLLQIENVSDYMQFLANIKEYLNAWEDFRAVW